MTTPSAPTTATKPEPSSLLAGVGFYDPDQEEEEEEEELIDEDGLLSDDDIGPAVVQRTFHSTRPSLFIATIRTSLISFDTL